MTGRGSFNNLSIKWKFTAISMAITLAALLVAAAALMGAATVHQREKMTLDIEQDAEIIGRNCSGALMFNDQTTAAEILSAMVMRPDVRRAAVYKPGGEVFATYNREGLERRAFPRMERSQWGWRFKGGTLVEMRPITMQGQEIGGIYMEKDLDDLYNNLQWVAGTMGAVIVLSLIAAFFVSLRLQRLFTKPISDLADAATSVSTSQDYSVRVAGERADELGDLIRVFNRMLGELQDREAKLAQYTEDLEKEVLKRTGELTVANERLMEELEERKVIEEKLIKAREEAEEATKLKDKFVSLLSHDLRAPLASTIGGIRLLRKTLGASMGQQQVSLAEKMEGSLEGLARMIDQLLDMSRLQTGNIKLHPRFITTYFLSALVMEKLEHLAKEKGITLVNEVPRQGRIFADHVLFTEVLQNIVSNAMKFSHPGGTVRIFVPDGKAATLAVSDTGVGIRPEIIPLLFRHEEKTSTIGTAGEKGTGLGLPFSHDIMKAHGGAITVESKEGEGSTFYLDLPPVSQITLVVDDQPAVRKDIVGFIAGSNVTIIEAENGLEALALLNGVVPHLIITDINMPEMDGFALLQRLRETPGTKDVPVIVMTSAGEDAAVREKAFLMGANDFVSKPLVPEDFLPRVKRFLG